VTRSPDLIVLGPVASLAGGAGFGWREGLAVAEGRIVAVGARADIAPLRGPRTRVVELGSGQMALPGLTDAHLHLAAAAVAADEIDLEGAPSLSAALDIVADAHAARLRAGDRNGWLFGHGWATDGWTSWPTAADLERVAPGRQIALWAHDHHTRWVSEAALHALGIGESTADPPGGHVGRDANGRLDGLLYEHATEIGDAAMPRPSEASIQAAIGRYARRLVALGVTGVHDPGGPDPDASLAGAFGAMRDLAPAEELPLRVHAGVFDLQLEAAIDAGLRSGTGVTHEATGDPRRRRAVERFRFGWLKLFADGTVGSRTAALLEPYSDAASRPGPAGPLGSLLESQAELRRQVARAASAGIATMIHAIGDRAVRTALDAFEAVGAARSATLPLRPRIEHAQLIQADDVPRFRQLGVAASVQPIHLRSDEATMRRAWGSRTSHAFPLASLAASGAIVAFGTDAPVEPPDPWPGIAMAVARWAPEWGSDSAASAPAEAIGLDAALRAVTVGPWQTTGDAVGGRLAVGAPADIVVLPIDLRAEPRPGVESLRSMRPLLTVIDGEECHRSPAFDR
jgi:predicted amidohydrolase YtcJ